MTIQEITEYLDDKIAKNENEIVITFYELRVKMNLSEKDADYFLKLCRARFQNLGYKVHVTGDRFVYKEANRMVQSNQLMIAIKEKWDWSNKNDKVKWKIIRTKYK